MSTAMGASVLESSMMPRVLRVGKDHRWLGLPNRPAQEMQQRTERRAAAVGGRWCSGGEAGRASAFMAGHGCWSWHRSSSQATGERSSQAALHLYSCY